MREMVLAFLVLLPLAVMFGCQNPTASENTSGSDGTPGEDGTQYVLVDSNDVLIGDALGGMSVVTSTGHYVGYIASNGEVSGQVYYSGTDGSGTAYAWGSLLSNQVVRDAVSGVLYQPATGEVIHSVETQSRAFDNDDSYSNVNSTMSYATELTPLGTKNALIGLPSSIAMPLRIEEK